MVTTGREESFRCFATIGIFTPQTMLLMGPRQRWPNCGDADLSHARLAQGDLRAAMLAGCRLIGASLRSANLLGANLTGATLVRTDLRRATLAQTWLLGTDFCDANLDQADFTIG